MARTRGAGPRLRRGAAEPGHRAAGVGQPATRGGAGPEGCWPRQVRTHASARPRARCSPPRSANDVAPVFDRTLGGAVRLRAGASARAGQKRAARHHRHAARRSRRRLRRTPARDTGAGRPRARRRALRTRVGDGADHAAVAREPVDGPYPPAHGARHNGMRHRDDVPTLATALRRRRVRDGRVRRRRFRSIAASACPRLRRLRRRAAARGRRPAAQRAARRATVDAGHRLAAARTATRVLSVGAPLRTARPVRHARRSRGTRGARDTTTRSPTADREVGRLLDGARRERARQRSWSSPPPITARRSASTARSATACSSTTRRCACR